MENPKSEIQNPNEIPNPKSQRERKPFNLRERTFVFAIRILEIASQLPRTGYGSRVADQVARAGTSIGANVEEGDGGLTRPEKRRAFVVARREAGETRYWLRIIDRVWGDTIKVKEDIAETMELINILSAIVSKLQ